MSLGKGQEQVALLCHFKNFYVKLTYYLHVQIVAKHRAQAEKYFKTAALCFILAFYKKLSATGIIVQDLSTEPHFKKTQLVL